MKLHASLILSQLGKVKVFFVRNVEVIAIGGSPLNGNGNVHNVSLEQP